MEGSRRIWPKRLEIQGFARAMDGRRKRWTLFSVLHLLAHLLDDHLHVHRGARGLQVLRFGGKCVGFAIELLHEEIQAPAGGLAAGNHPPHLRDVSVEAFELLVHIEPLQQQRELLLDALALDARTELSEALIEPGAYARVHFRQPVAYSAHERLECRTALLEQLAQPRTLARASCHQLFQRRTEYRISHGEQLLATGTVLTH